MNQNLRDFSDRHFIVKFRPGEPYNRYRYFERYEDASRCVKDLVCHCKAIGLSYHRGLTINQFIYLTSVMKPWNEREV